MARAVEPSGMSLFYLPLRLFATEFAVFQPFILWDAARDALTNRGG
jgi:hypothetical protein